MQKHQNGISAPNRSSWIGYAPCQRIIIARENHEANTISTPPFSAPTLPRRRSTHSPSLFSGVPRQTDSVMSPHGSPPCAMPARTIRNSWCLTEQWSEFSDRPLRIIGAVTTRAPSCYMNCETSTLGRLRGSRLRLSCP